MTDSLLARARVSLASLIQISGYSGATKVWKQTAQPKLCCADSTHTHCKGRSVQYVTSAPQTHTHKLLSHSDRGLFLVKFRLYVRWFLLVSDFYPLIKKNESLWLFSLTMKWNNARPHTHSSIFNICEERGEKCWGYSVTRQLKGAPALSAVLLNWRLTYFLLHLFSVFYATNELMCGLISQLLPAL